MTTSAQRTILISYSPADQAWADWIAGQLTAHGLAALPQAWDFRPHEPIASEIERAMKGFERTVVVLSPAYVTALQTRPEWASALSHNPGKGAGRFLAVRVREYDLQVSHANVPFVDLVGLDEAEAGNRLVGALLGSEPAPPDAPEEAEWRAESFAAPYPGAPPPVWHFPPRRDPAFTGREHELAEVASSLASHGAVVLTGLPGAGKTAVAVEYAYRHATRYSVVWWMSRGQRAADFKHLVREIERRPDADKGAAAWLSHEDWLLVFDDVEAPSDLEDMLPSGASGHVIAVSRGAQWRDRGWPTVLVEAMVPSKAVELLLKRTAQTDEAAAAEVAAGLGYLPLALEMATELIREGQLTLSGYANELRGRSHRPDRPQAQLPAFVLRAADLWATSFDELREDSPAAAALLELCSFFAPTDIPRALLTVGAGLLPPPLGATASAPEELGEALGLLHRVGFARLTDDALSISSLVQTVTRRRVDHRAGDWAATAVEVVNSAFPFAVDDPSAWPTCARLRPHALAAAGHAEGIGVAGATTVRLLNQLGLYALERDDEHEAERTLERAHRLASSAFNPDVSELATVLNNLGGAFEAMGDLGRAREHYERALEIDRNKLGAEHPQVAIRLNNLGSVLERLDELMEARDCYERALEIEQANDDGGGASDMALRLSNLGGILERLGDLEGAHERYRQALETGERRTGSNPAEVATIHNNLGVVLWRRGNLEEARSHLRLALEIDELAHGPSDPELGTTLLNLGGVLHSLGDLNNAQAHFERALAIALAHDPRGAEALAAATRLGETQQARNDHASASRTFERGLDVARAALRPNDLEVARMLARLAHARAKLGDFVGARDRLERALAIVDSERGPEDLEVARILGKLGRVLQNLGDPQAARAAIHRALEIYQAAWGMWDRDVPAAVRSLAVALEDLGDLDGARDHLSRALVTAESTLGADHTETARVLDQLGVIRLKLNDFEQARVALQRAASLYRATFGPESSTLATALRNLGGVLKSTGRLREAREQFEQAAAIHGTGADADREELALDLANLGIVAEELGELDGARASYADALKILQVSLGPEHVFSLQLRDRIAEVG